MTKRGLYLFAFSVFAVLSLTYALFAPVWFISFPLGVLGAMGAVGLMFAPVFKDETPPPANKHNPQKWMYGKNYGEGER